MTSRAKSTRTEYYDLNQVLEEFGCSTEHKLLTYELTMLIQNLKVTGLLSFGPEGIDLPLGNLNVLVGPNGSGKSNFIEVLALLKAAPKNLPEPVKEMGGVHEWLWKGKPRQ